MRYPNWRKKPGTPEVPSYSPDCLEGKFSEAHPDRACGVLSIIRSGFCERGNGCLASPLKVVGKKCRKCTWRKGGRLCSSKLTASYVSYVRDSNDDVASQPERPF